MNSNHFSLLALALTAGLTSQQQLIPPGGLAAPVGILSDAQGQLYISTQGDGATLLGSLVRYEPATASQTVIRADFPTLLVGAGHPVGAHHMAWHPTLPGVLSVAVSTAQSRLEDLDATTGATIATYDVSTFVLAQSFPGGDTNLYSVANDSAGNRYVVDTGANAIIKVDPAGVMSVFATLPNRPATAPPFIGQQAVPTKLLSDGSDGFWVANLSGAPFLPGASDVAHIDSAGVVTTAYAGLANVVDLAVNPRDGALYAAGLGDFDLTFGGFVPGTGSIVRLDAAGPVTVLGGLSAPTGLTFTPDGDLYYLEYADATLGPGFGSLSRLRASAADNIGAGCGAGPLALSSSAAAVGGDWTLTEDNLAPGASGLFFFGDTVIDPAFDLGALGAPGCEIYTNANIDMLVAAQTAGSASVTIQVPATPALVGSGFVVQAAGQDSTLPFGLATSNGLQVVFGEF